MDSAISALWGVGALVLVISGLVAQRLPLAKTLKMALAWIGIFGIVFVLFLFRNEGRAIWNRIVTELSGDAGRVDGGSVRLERQEDGHFWIRAMVDGTPVRFMIDSGATTTTLSIGAAHAANIDPGDAFPVMVDTANGPITLQRAQVKRLEIGPIRLENAPVLIGNEALGSTNLLGMSFLSSLKSWRVEGSTMILEQ